MTAHSSSEPVNILYCEGNTDGTVGGSYFSLLYLVSGLDRMKYNPIVVFHKEHTLLDQYHQAGIKILIIPRPTPTIFTKPRNNTLKLFYPLGKILQKGINFLKFYPLTGIQYALLIKKLNIKLVHLNNSILRNNNWILGSKLAGIKCLTHERGIKQYYPRMPRYCAKQLDAIICISDAVRHNLVSHGINPGNLITIYNGIDPNIITVNKTEEQIRQQHGIANNDFLIGVIGNIMEWKGQETAIRAMPRVLQLYPNTVCLLVGDTSQTDLGYKKRLLQLTSELGIENRIIFTGYTKNVANYLNAMKVVMHTSVNPEPFGRVLIEAMSMKKPLIGTRAGAVPEIIDEGKTGFTFPPGDDVILAEAIKTLLANPEKATQMGKAGYIRLIDNFHISKNLDKTQELYDNILGYL